MDQLKQEIDFDVPPPDYPPGGEQLRMNSGHIAINILQKKISSQPTVVIFHADTSHSFKHKPVSIICHTPFPEVRPGIGCRSLVQRSLYHIIPGLLTDLDDWQAGPRLQAAKLLAMLILNADSGVTQYAEKVLAALHLAVGDKEASIVNQVGCSASVKALP